MTYFGEFSYLNSSCIRIKYYLLRFWVFREINSRFCCKTQWQMFLLVSGRHVGAHLGGHQYGVSIQISINLRKTFLRISSIKKNSSDLNLGEGLCISIFFLFPDSRLNLLNGFYFFILMYFEWRDTANQQYVSYFLFLLNSTHTYNPSSQSNIFPRAPLV